MPRVRALRWSGVLAGIAAVVAGGLLYRHSMASATAVATCVDDTNQHVVNEQYCSQGYADSHGYIGHYVYYFGGSVRDGAMSGGSYLPPDLGVLRTTDGIVLRRGGFGVPDPNSSSGSNGSNGDQVGNSGAGDEGGSDEGDVGSGGDVGGGDVGGGEGGGEG